MLTFKALTLFIAFFTICIQGHPHDHARSNYHRRWRCVWPSASLTTSSLHGTASPKPSHAPSTNVTSSTTSERKTVTSSSVASPPSSSVPSGSLLSQLFPFGHKFAFFTTAPSEGALPLADSTFNPKNVDTHVPYTYAPAPDGIPSLKVHYPAGSYTFNKGNDGGFSFYASGPHGVDLTTAKEATFGYRVFFPTDFDFVYGGKLPGLYGGDDAEVSINCSGGRRNDTCFSVRLMWRTDGMGELYTYLPPTYSANRAVCHIPPLSDCNPTYGASVGRGSFKFARGQWTTVSQRVRLNDPGKANGQLELFANGRRVIMVYDVILVTSCSGTIWGMQMQSFFGGSHPQFATPKAQNAYFADFSVAITALI